MGSILVSLDSVAFEADRIQKEALNNGYSNPDLSQQPESTRLSGRFNLSAKTDALAKQAHNIAPRMLFHQ